MRILLVILALLVFGWAVNATGNVNSENGKPVNPNCHSASICH